ncbi:MAG: TIGR02266 family protein [Deltaproteobacteria bacterium]|nr:TIGR02266 family protein [Deltaproteobacteria bacterium]
MSNEERQDNRVDAALKVRYKTATISDFIEKHSHDISSGGVFIRAKKPMPKGTLMKIDFRLEDNTPVIIGVGRVVWTRKPSDDENKPPGMGIKFIKLDDASRQNIENIIQFKKEGRELTRDSVIPPMAKGVTGPQPAIFEAKKDEDPTDDSEEKDNIDQQDNTENPVDDDNTETPESQESDNNEKSDNVYDDEDVTSRIDVAEQRKQASEDKRKKAEKSTGGVQGVVIAVIIFIALASLVYYYISTSDSNSTDTEEISADNQAVADTDNSSDSVAKDSGEDTGSEVEKDSGPVIKLSGPVNIVTNIAEAKIKINGELKGVSPLTIDSIPLTDDIVISAELFGYIPQTLTIQAEENSPINETLSLVKAKTIILFQSNVTKAVIQIDNKWAGTTPVTIGRNFTETVSYSIKKPGYTEMSGTVNPEDWTYDEGVYKAVVEVNMIPVAETVKPAPVIKKPVAASKPVTVPEVKPETAPKPVTVPEVKPETATPKPAPVPEVKPEPVPKTVPAPEVKPEPAPKPAPVPKESVDENPYG